MRAALADGHTNYPPSDGVLALREAVARFYEREPRASKYPVESVLITGGARPLLYGAYRTVLDPGRRGRLPGAVVEQQPLRLPVRRRAPSSCRSRADVELLPDAPSSCARTCASARLLADQLAAQPDRHGRSIPRCCGGSASWSSRRTAAASRAGGDARKALWLCYDQVYWQLTFGGATPRDAARGLPDVAPYTIMLDAASKAFAATGLRVGWAVMPPAARQRMADILGHVGAWAPKAEQVAMAALLDDEATIAAYHADDARPGAGAARRAGRGVRGDARDGCPVEVIAPQGAIYLSVRVALPGRDQRGDAQASPRRRPASRWSPSRPSG